MAYVPEVDHPILAAGDHYRYLEHQLRRAFPGGVSEARHHLRQLESSPDYRRDHEAIEQVAAKWIARDQETVQHLAPALLELLPHLLQRRAWWMTLPYLPWRTESLTRKLIGSLSDATQRLDTLGPSRGLPQMTTDELDNLLLHFHSERRGGDNRPLPTANQARWLLREAPRNLVRVAALQDREEVSSSARQAARDIRRLDRQHRPRGVAVGSEPDLKVNQLLTQLGYPEPIDQREQLSMMHRVHEGSDERVHQQLTALAAARQSLLDATGESTLRGALAQVNNSQRALSGPRANPEHRVVSAGLPSLGRRR